MVSIIIPAFNAEKYLSAAIGSIISQSVPDWELILVDDGSTDSTPAICDSAAAADPRIRALHIPNSGVSAARNAGLDAARGDFIAFLDADDLLLTDFISSSLSALRETGAKLAAAPFRSAKNPEALTRKKQTAQLSGVEGEARNSPVLLPLEQALSALLYQTPVAGTGCIFDTSVWGKLYSRELWADLRFRENIRFEDLDIFYRILLRAGAVAFIPEPLLIYRLHGSSFLHNYTPARLDVLDVTDRMVADIATGCPDALMAARTRRFAAHCNILLLLRRNGRPDREAEKRCLRLIRKEATMVRHNSHARLKDRLGALLAPLLLPFFK